MLKRKLKRKPRFRSTRLRINRLLNVKTVKLDGVRVNVDANTSLIGSQTWRALMSAQYEFPERQLLKATIRPGDRVLEIGACLGVISILAARLAGGQNVVSYEANPALEKEIRANYELNRLYPKLIMKAVTPEGGTSVFYISHEACGSSSQQVEGTWKLEVESESINQAIMDHDPSVLVVDAEGAEIQLLQHADLRNIRAAIVEFHPLLTGEEDIAEAKDALAAKGFNAVMTHSGNVAFERTALRNC